VDAVSAATTDAVSVIIFLKKSRKLIFQATEQHEGTVAA